MLNLIAPVAKFPAAIKRRLFARRNFERRITSGVRKIVIGSAGFFDTGWAGSEATFLSLTNRSQWHLYFEPGSLEAILAEHVWEHLDEKQAVVAVETCFEFLRPGGRLRIAVPDGYHCDDNYIEAVRPGGTGSGSDDHRVLYNYESLSLLLAKAGFDVTLLEYFDANRQFHATFWNPADGMVRRSIRFDPRNRDGLPTYTSLLVDAYKP